MVFHQAVKNAASLEEVLRNVFKNYNARLRTP
jgi:hypothetical protein